MDVSCRHVMFLMKSVQWFMSEPLEFWTTSGNVIIKDLGSFEFAPNVHFSIAVHSYGEDWGFFQFCSTDPFAHLDFDVFLWVGQDGVIISDTSCASLTVNDGHEVIHNFKPFILNCDMHYKKKCPYCTIEENQNATLIAAQDPVPQVERMDTLSSLTDTLSNRIDVGSNPSTLSSFEGPTLVSAPLGMFDCYKQKAKDAKENVIPNSTKSGQEEMDEQEMLIKFQQDFFTLSFEQRAVIVRQMKVFKEASNLS
ncbi:hypothetical protein M3Y96_00534400 [Aphelenchoides besseyi]|nr:hypothetical protein M3Y96_00534400 [Aphelenchoides besseyi]